MRELTPEEYQRKKRGDSPDSKEKWWTIDANARYKGVTYEYLQCVMGGGKTSVLYLAPVF